MRGRSIWNCFMPGEAVSGGVSPLRDTVVYAEGWVIAEY